MDGIAEYLCFSESPSRCRLARRAFDVGGDLSASALPHLADILLGEVRIPRGTTFDYFVLDAVGGVPGVRWSAATRLEVWDLRLAALLRAAARIEAVRDMLADVGIAAPSLRLREVEFGTCRPRRSSDPGDHMRRLERAWNRPLPGGTG